MEAEIKYLFHTEARGGFVIQADPHPSMVKYAMEGEGEDRTRVQLTEIRSSSLAFDWATQALRIVDDEIQVVDRPPAPVSPEKALADAREGMSQLIATLSVESRSKFAEARAGVEKLLDIGDIEAAHYKVGQIPTETQEEATVKATLVDGLSQFLMTDS